MSGLVDNLGFEELVEMEKLMNVYEEVSGGKTAFGSQLDALVNPFRHFVMTEEVQVKEAPFSTSQKASARLYLFQDLVILAVPTGSGTPKSIGSLLESDTAAKRKTLKRYRGAYKVWRWLDLARCTVKMADETVLQVTFVTRHSEVDPKKPKGTMKILTRVEKVEISTSTADGAKKLYKAMTCFIDDIIESDLRRMSMSSERGEFDSSEAGSRASLSRDGTEIFGQGEDGEQGGMGERTRSWASRKNTLRRNGTLKSNGRSSQRLSEHENPSVSGLSLADIESRYQLNLDAPALPNGSVEFFVEYGEGPMGFSLSSSPNIGVIVGRVSEGSFSEDAGVCVGDRVVEVDGQVLELDSPWQTVVEIIKKSNRPLRIKFERLAGRVEEKEKDADVEAPVPPSAAASSASSSQEKSERKRAWAKKRQHRAHATETDDQRLVSLTEMEKLYRSGKNLDSEDIPSKISAFFKKLIESTSSGKESMKLAASVLQEIWTSERTYVLSMRTIVREFIIPLRRKTKRSKCKDLEGSRICDHGKLRSNCSLLSAEAILSNADMLTIFLNTETLLKINTELLNHIEKELLQFHDKQVSVLEVASVFGPAFEKVMPYFQLYGVYSHGYVAGIDRLLICRTGNPELDIVLKERERKAGVMLQSLLIKPVQRVCKYPLLFRELLKQTSQLQVNEVENERIKGLEHASEVAEKIAQSVDKYVEKHESNDTLLDIFNELGGEQHVPWLIAPHRKFVTRVNVLMNEAPYQQEPKLHIMYVCNDIIILGKSKDIEGFGSGTKTGGRQGKGMSLVRSAGNSLKKSLRSSVQRLSSPTSHNSTTLSAHGKSNVKFVKKLELAHTTPTIVAEKDDAGCYAIELKVVERLEDPKGKTVTNIIKMKIWLPSCQEQTAVYEDLYASIDLLKSQQEGHQKAQLTLGTPKATRSWKTRTKSSGSHSDQNFSLDTPNRSRHESLSKLVKS